MSEERPFENANLMIGNRLNWEYIQGIAVLKYIESLVQPEGSLSEQQVEKAAKAIVATIPDGYRKRDKKWQDEFDRAIKKTRKVDTRRSFCGRKVGEKTAENQKEEEYVDSEELFHVAVNHLQRTGVIGKNAFTEKMVPKPEDFEGIEEDEDAEPSEDQ